MKPNTLEETQSRNQFLKDLGLRGSALLAVYCLGKSMTSCKSEGVTPAPLTNSITVDLTSTANAALKTVGGYIVTSNVVVANTTQGYVAVTVVCSHEGQKKVQLRNNEFYCPEHGARYDLSGKGLNSEGKNGLTVYKVSQSGNILTIS